MSDTEPRQVIETFTDYIIEFVSHFAFVGDK